MKDYQVSKEEYCLLCDEYFKQRSIEAFQKDIDRLILKLNILDNFKFWKFYIDNTNVECLSTSESQDFNQLLNSVKFTNIEQAYFFYKVCLEFIDLKEKLYVNLTIVSDKDKKLTLQKKYFDILLNAFSKDKKSVSLKIDFLDTLLKESAYKIKVHKKAISTTANLLGINKNSSFRVNTDKDGVVGYKIRSIQQGEVRKIKCPVCSHEETLDINNKDSLFKTKGKDIVLYTCKHLNHEDAKKKPVEILIKEYLENLNGIDQVDFVLWNYLIFFEKFTKDMENDPL